MGGNLRPEPNQVNSTLKEDINPLCRSRTKTGLIPSKITQLKKHVENFNSIKKRTSTDANAKVTQILKLSDKNFKEAI